MNNNKKQALAMLKNGGLFIFLISFTFYLVFRQNNIKDVFSTITQVNFGYIVLGIASMCIFVCCEASNIGRSLTLFGYTFSFKNCLKYALVGFFFSSVTPAASGGQPMQVYYMNKDNIKVSHSVLALLIELSSYQTVTVSFALVGVLAKYSILRQTLGSMRYLLWAGLVLNVGILILLLTAIFCKRAASAILNGVTFVLRKLHYRKMELFTQKATKQIQEYQASAIYFRKNKIAIIKILLTTCVQITAWYSVPFWVYRAFGLLSYTMWSVIGMQAVLYITVSALPLPGAVGITESGFVVLFKALFPTTILSGAMLLSRGISFYLFVLISGIAVAFYFLLGNRTIIKQP